MRTTLRIAGNPTVYCEHGSGKINKQWRTGCGQYIVTECVWSVSADLGQTLGFADNAWDVRVSCLHQTEDPMVAAGKKMVSSVSENTTIFGAALTMKLASTGPPSDWLS